MARLLAESPGRHTTRQATYLLFTLTLAGVVLLWSTARMQADAQPRDLLEGAEAGPGGPAPGLIEAPSLRRPGTDGGAEQVEAPSITPEQRMGADAMARISYPWRDRLDDGWTVEFLPAQDGLYGLTRVTQRRIEIYVRLDRELDFLVHVIAHELGHAVDVTLFDDDDRDRWRQQRALGDAPWWPDNAASDFSTGAGDFAESFAAWQTEAAYYRGELADPPGTADLELLADLAYRAG